MLFTNRAQQQSRKQGVIVSQQPQTNLEKDKVREIEWGNLHGAGFVRDETLVGEEDDMALEGLEDVRASSFCHGGDKALV